MSWDKINKAWIPSDHPRTFSDSSTKSMGITSGEQVWLIDTSGDPYPSITNVTYGGSFTLTGNYSSNTYQIPKIVLKLHPDNIQYPVGRWPSPYYRVTVSVRFSVSVVGLLSSVGALKFFLGYQYVANQSATLIEQPLINFSGIKTGTSGSIAFQFFVDTEKIRSSTITGSTSGGDEIICMNTDRTDYPDGCNFAYQVPAALL